MCVSMDMDSQVDLRIGNTFHLLQFSTKLLYYFQLCESYKVYQKHLCHASELVNHLVRGV